jgi:putative PIN family toxin of toxin-antitoxin system
MRSVAIEASPTTPLIASGAVVIDTNIVLDLFVFDDAAARPLRQALERGELQWMATAAMRDELARVLDYPQIVPRLAFYKLAAADVLARFDANARLAPVPPKAAPTCKDADDQKFIDLAVAHQAILLSKDRAVLSMKKRLAVLSVSARSALVAMPAALKA